MLLRTAHDVAGPFMAQLKSVLTTRGQACVQDGSPPVIQILTLHFWCTKDQRLGQVNHLILPSLAYYSSNVNMIRVCVSAEIRPLEMARQYHGRSSDMNMSFKQFPGLSVSAIASPRTAL